MPETIIKNDMGEVVSVIPDAADAEATKANRINRLVDDAIRLDGEIVMREAQLAVIKEQLAVLPSGKYFSLDGTGRVTVVAPGKQIKPGESQITAARSLAGSLAGKLFTRHVVYKPVGSFRDIALALLSPKKAQKILALCEVPTPAQVRI